MKVWVLRHKDYGFTQIWSEDTDPLEIPTVKDELSHLVGAYDDELEEFMLTIQNGYGDIEERFSIRLESVKELS